MPKAKSVEEARKYVEDQGYETGQAEIGKHYYKFRQKSPQPGTYATLDVGMKGGLVLLGWKQKGKKSLIIQSVLVERA